MIEIISWWMLLGVLVNWLALSIAGAYGLYKVGLLDWDCLKYFFAIGKSLDIEGLSKEFGVFALFIGINFFILFWPVFVFLILKNAEKVVDRVADEYNLK